MKTSSLLVLAILALTNPWNGAVQAATLFPRASQWKYFKGTSEASTPDTTAWRANGFDDSGPGWLTGDAPFFYENASGYTGNTDLTDMGAGAYTCIFMRRTFNIADPSQVAQLQLDMDSDDGCIVWINGVEVASLGRPADPITFQSLAPNADSEPKSDVPIINNPSTFLVAGANTIAVQAFNQSSGSSDFLIDVALSGSIFDSIPPVVSSFNPAPGVIDELTQITVIFSEEVDGVDGIDLTLNGLPATSVVGSLATYTFFFPQPAYGPVQVGWADGHGIVDVGVPGIPFDPATPGNTWQYTLRDSFPPRVAETTPRAGSTVTELTSIEVAFDEPVTGVDATDLVVAGSVVTGLVALDSSRYRFEITEPPIGMVAVAFSASHGITDLAAAPNAFQGEAWHYTLDPDAIAATLVISEFMSSNRSILADEDGDFEDWIEIHNSGEIAADLNRWCLTDNPDNLNKWRFPATNLLAGDYMIIFASEKNRRTPGAPLHTNFRLNTQGEFLALVKPDGVTIVSSYSPTYPPQVEDVSYGLSTVSEAQTLLADNAPAKYLIPGNGSLGLDWTMNGFNDGSWSSGANGIGFEGDPGATANLSGDINTDIASGMQMVNSTAYLRLPFNVADASIFRFLTLRMKYDDGFIAYLNGSEVARRGLSAQLASSAEEFSGVQGQNNWFHGYFNKTQDDDGVYQASEFIPFAGGPGQGAWNGTSQQWTGTQWDLNTASAPPWTELGAMNAHPNGSNNGDQHWPIRRWVSEVSQDIVVRFHLRKSNINGGNGVTGRIFRNGLEVFNRTIAFNDASLTTNDVRIAGVAVGDMIDIALDARGTDSTFADGSDGSILTANIELENGLAPAWNSAATSSHADADAVVYEDIDLGEFLDGLQTGPNVLAIHGLNVGPSDNDFLIKAEIQGRQSGTLSGETRYFTAPTPGSENGVGVDVLGPVLSGIDHKPNVPLPNEPLKVTIRVTPTFFPVSTVTLRYRAMYGPISLLAMGDNGAAGDEAAGDGIYTAVIPAGQAIEGQMIRWNVTAVDNQARSTRYPPFEDPLNSPEYDGTMVFLAQTNDLPVLHMFAASSTAIDNAATTRCSLFYDGLFYDNLDINIHGQSSSGFPKHSYDIDFHRGFNFRWKRGEELVDDINLLTTYPDKAYMRNMLAYDTYRFADGPYHFVEPVRVQLNGTFYGVWHLVENGDDNWLKRLGRNPNNALYKMYNTFSAVNDYTISSSEAEKKTRKEEGNADLMALYNGIVVGSTQSRTNYMFDNIDIPGSIDHLAARVLTSDRDCCHKNYYFYRDSEGTGEWECMPWDVDLSFGRNWKAGPVTYWDNTSYTNNTLFVGGNNGFCSQLFSFNPTRQMYLRRVRTLMDTLQQSPSTLPHEQVYESWIDQYANVLRADAAMDLERWGTWFDTGNNTPTVADPNHTGLAGPIMDPSNPDYESLDQAVVRLKEYMRGRRGFMFSKMISSEIPDPQPANATLAFGAIEANPSSGLQAQEYLQLVNQNSYAVDISGWRLAGAIQHTFKGGTVVPAGFSLYVSPDVNGFRARTASPRAEQGRFVQGNYQGQLSARGESIQLVNAAGVTNQTITYPGNPSLAQRYLRVTEIMYHAAPAPAGSEFTTEDYEYIELKNISLTETVPLAGIHFTNGVEFAFDGSLPSLAPGQSVVLVQNEAAFISRYGAGSTIAGEYQGLLSNGGERIRLDDAVGEKILDFDYNNSWYPITDGLGFSLVIVDENAPFDTWDLKTSWRPSGRFNGSPGGSDPAPVVVGPVLVNEALTHTDLPQVDTIELYNTNASAVNVGGWFLTDDFSSPTKYRIPDNTMIPANGYRIFDESDFNPDGTGPAGFSLSSKGDEVYLFAGDGTLPTGYYHGFSYGAAQNGVTFGRYVTSLNEEHFVAQSSNTLLAANALPKVGPVVIEEIMYHPPDLAGRQDNDDEEFVELHNISGATVFLYDPAAPANTWELRGAVKYAFAPGTTLAAGAYLLVVNFDPFAEPATLASFRTRYAVPVGVAIQGPYSGQLDNSAEDVELYRPDTPEQDEVPYILIDRVEYRDDIPWPAEADGLGASLQRIQAGEYGNDPTNWFAAAPSAGVASAAGTLPSVTGHPANVSALLGGSAQMTVTASGSPPLRYQWRFQGSPIFGQTAATLSLSRVQFSDSGPYDVVVYNGAGVVISQPGTLQVLVPAAILTQPVGVSVQDGSPATFTIQAVSSSLISYQWRKNGGPIPGAIGSSYTIGSVSTSDDAIYDVLVTDSVGTIVSDPVRLLVLVTPAVVQPPITQTVAVGGTAVFGIETTGSLPMGYRWRKGATTLRTDSLFSNSGFLVIENAQLSDAGAYSVVLTNAAFFTPGVLVRNFNLVVLADSDGDGIPDSVETANGWNPNDPSDANVDTDGDGSSNGDEYIAGTDWLDPNSFLKVESLTLGQGVNIMFMAVANRTYTVEYKNALSDFAWSRLADVVASPDPAIVVVPDTDGSPSRIYRLVTPRNPE